MLMENVQRFTMQRAQIKQGPPEQQQQMSFAIWTILLAPLDPFVCSQNTTRLNRGNRIISSRAIKIQCTRVDET